MNTPILSWIQQIGTSQTDFIFSVKTDSKQNILIAGMVQAELVQNQHQGGHDAYLAKYNADGDLIWQTQLGSLGVDIGFEIDIDPIDHIYITGRTSGEIFLAKYDPDGDQVWLQQFGTDSNDSGYGIASDARGNVYVCGATTGSMSGDSAGGVDIFLSKFNEDGTSVWTQQLGSASADEGFELDTDGHGNVYLVGMAAGELIADDIQGSGRGLLAKYDPDGNLIWIRRFEAQGSLDPLSVTSDQQGQVWICGSKRSDGSTKGFVSKFNSDGELQWTHEVGSGIGSRLLGICIDHFGNVYAAGSAFGQVVEGQHRGSGDVLFTKLDPEGNMMWIKQMGTTSPDGVWSMDIDVKGNLYIGGLTGGQFTADGNAGLFDMFLAKYEEGFTLSQHNRQIQAQLDQIQRAQIPMDLDLSLIQAAKERTTGRGGSRLSRAEAQEIVALAKNGSEKISNIRKKTLAFIYARNTLTRGAKEVIVGAL